MADASANTTVNMETTSPHSSAGNEAYQDEEFIRQFGAVQAQLNVENIVLLAASVRQDMQARQDPERNDLPSVETPAIGCKVFSEPLRGSYNLAYRVLFDDGLEWILKVPANGSRARWDNLAANALTSEALTMKLIKRSTTVPVPTIYSFDASLDNEIGCPYILMEFLKGRPLYEGWFHSGISSAKLEQFRARALQTVAAAMVQLNSFTLHRGGAIRFNSAGEPVDVVGAKVPDAKAFFDGIDENSYPEHDVWCEKGPTADPSNYLLFNLNRRGYQEEDSEYIRGVHELTRLFAKRALDLSQKMYPQGQQFVLTHPDLDFQNILVLEDGTLTGILDWDGVAAVPLSVGCLKFPNWLVRDWDPNNYNWNVEDHVPYLLSGRLENTPDELVAYRAMYAQFIEMLLPSNSANDTAGKMGANLTRLSLISLSLEMAANYQHSTGRIIGHLFREMKRASGEPDDDEISEAGAVASNIGSDEGLEERPSISDGERSNEETLSRWDEAEDRNSDEDTTSTEVENSASDLSDDAKPKLPDGPGQERIATLHKSSLGVVNKDVNEMDLPALAALGTTLLEPAKIETKSENMPLSDHVAAEETTRDQNAATSRKIRVIQWALRLGEKGCRKACKAFYKKKPAVPLIPEDADNCQTHKPCQQEPHQGRGSEGDEATEIDPENVWANIAADVDKGGIPIEWVNKRRDMITQCVIKNLGQEIKQEKEKELRLKNKKAAKKTKRARQPTMKTDGKHESIPSTDQTPSVESEKSNSSDVVAVERKPTLIEIFETCMAEKLETTNQSDVSAVAEAVIQAEKPASAKPNPEHAAFPESSITALGRDDSDGVYPGALRSDNNPKGSMKPESLISKLEHAKQRYDVKAALEASCVASGNLAPGNAGSKTVQLKFTKPPKPKPNGATLVVAEEAHQIQRLSSTPYAESGVVYTEPISTFTQARENDRSATEHHRDADSQTWRLNDPFYRAIDIANNYAMAMLLKIREPDAADEGLQGNSSLITDNVEEDSDREVDTQASPSTSVTAVEPSNLATQQKASVMSGRWFETPRGSLKRIDDADAVGESLNDPEQSSRLSKSSSEENGGSSKTSKATHGSDDTARLSNGQLLSPNHNLSRSLNVFRVPDVDDDDGDDVGDDVGDDDEDDDGGVKLDLTRYNTGELTDESEKDVLYEEDVDLVNEGPENASREEAGNRGPMVTVDYGAFNMNEVCVALGSGNLDEARMEKLKDWFNRLLAEVLGRI